MQVVIERVGRICSAHLTLAARGEVEAVLRDVAGVRRWLDGIEVAAAMRLERLADAVPSLNPKHVVAEATQRDVRSGECVAKRAAIAGRMPSIAEALALGDISGDHVDVVQATVTHLDPSLRTPFEACDGILAAAAVGLSPDEFRAVVRREVQRLEADDGLARLERQKRQVNLRMWTDRDSGMVRLSGQFDPETGAALMGRVDATIERLFHGTVPDGCPADPGVKNDFLRAHALLASVTASGSTSISSSPPGARAEEMIVVDHATLAHGRHRDTRLDVTGGVELPVDTVRRLTCLADLVPIVLDERGVAINVGRTRRLATAAQRRALRAMHPTCAVPGCTVAFDRTEPHHITFFRHGGATNLDNLVPLCSRHHHRAHEGGWQLQLQPDHTLLVTLPDGTKLATGPPGRPPRDE